MTKPVAFVGPSLSSRPSAAMQHLLKDFRVLPPAQRGDIIRVLGAAPASIVLIDGLFHSVPSVTHKELLYALESGVRVLGASSMGALRAAELADFGMEPHGRIAWDFVHGTFEGDDEVALLHGPEEMGFPALTVPLVEVRYCLEQLVVAGLTEREKAGAVIDALQGRCFTLRTKADVASISKCIGGDALAEAVLERLSAFSWKERDAEAALRAALGNPSTNAAICCPESPNTVFLGYFKERYLTGHPENHGLAEQPTLQRIFWCYQVLNPKAAEFVWRVRRRYLLGMSLRLERETPADKEVAQAKLGLEAMRREVDGAHLPAPEIDAEARLRAAAAAATARFGSESNALRRLARHFGLDDRETYADAVLQLAAHQYDFVPMWACLRAFAFERSYHASAQVAADLVRMHRNTRVWSHTTASRRRAAIDGLAKHWQVRDGADFVAEAARRALYPAVNLFEAAGFLSPVLEPQSPEERTPIPAIEPRINGTSGRV